MRGNLRSLGIGLAALLGGVLLLALGLEAAGYDAPAALAALFHFAFQTGRPVGMMQDIGPPVTDSSQPGQAKSNAELRVLITVGPAKLGIKSAHAQKVRPGAGHVDTDKWYAKEV